MLELIAIITIIILFALFLKWRGKTGTPTGENKKVSEKLSPDGIVGKSSFILTTRKSTVPKADLSGKMDIEVPLEYEPDIETIEEQEELEQFGLPSEISSDITFEDMMEVVNEIENLHPQNPVKTGKLLHENENTDWVEQIASSSSDFQKRIVELIDLHLEKLEQNEGDVPTGKGLMGFDIDQYT